MRRRLKELAEWVGGKVLGDEEVQIHGVASIEEAQEGQITFIANPKYLPRLSETHASAVIVSPEVTSSARSLLRVKDPYLAFAKILTLFSQKPYQSKGVDPQAWISPTSNLGKDVTIYPLVYVGDHCFIGDRVTLFPGVYMGEDCSIGEDSILHANVSVYPGMVLGNGLLFTAGQ